MASTVYIKAGADAQFAYKKAYAVKTANQSVTSNAGLTAVADLTAAVVSPNVYKFDFFLIYDGPVAGDIKFVPTFPGTSTCEWTALGVSSAVSSATTVGSGQFAFGNESTASLVLGTADAATLLVGRITGYLTAGGSGNLGISFGQSVSTGSATTVYAKSKLTVARVA